MQRHFQAQPGGRVEGEQVVDQGEIRGSAAVAPGRLVHGGQVLEPPEARAGFVLEVAQDLLEATGLDLEGRHVRRVRLRPHGLPEAFHHGMGQVIFGDV